MVNKRADCWQGHFRMASESSPLIESSNSTGISMMENGLSDGDDGVYSTYETQPLLQQRYEQKHEGE